MTDKDFSGVSSKLGTPTPPKETTERFIRRPEVCLMTSLPNSSLTDLIAKGQFPKPYKLSERMSAWKISEVLGWINSRGRAA